MVNVGQAPNDEVFAGIYADVEKDFAALYRFVNRDDEVGCCRFQRHRVRCIYEIGGGHGATQVYARVKGTL